MRGGINSTVLPGVREDGWVGEAIGRVLQLWYCGEVWVGLGKGHGKTVSGKERRGAGRRKAFFAVSLHILRN